MQRNLAVHSVQAGPLARNLHDGPARRGLDPELETILRVAKSLGLKLSFKAA